MAEDKVLFAQIDALLLKLRRIDPMLQNDEVKRQYDHNPAYPRQPIYGKFNTVSAPLMADLEQLKRNLRQNKLTVAQAWQQYTTYLRRGQRVFAQCLDLLGGIAVRVMGLEDNFCDRAEDLVRVFADKTGISWSSVMILGEKRLFDDVAAFTQIIRLQFPEWDIWSMPFIAHEFGQLAASSDAAIPGLKDFFSQEGERICKLIKDPRQDSRALEQDVTPAIYNMIREKYQASQMSLTDVEEFLEWQRFHMKILFADIFATYFIGPAYLYARIYLRLIPTDISSNRTYQPPLAFRMAFMLKALVEMNTEAMEEEANDGDSGPYQDAIRRCTNIWEQTVRAANPEYQGQLELGEPYAGWFDAMYSALTRRYRYDDVAFQNEDWSSAKELSKYLANAISDQLPLIKRSSLPVGLNAAWHCRVVNETPLPLIEKKVAELWPMLGKAKGGSTGPAGQPQTRS